MYLVRQYRRDGKLKLVLAVERQVRASHPELTRRAKRQPLRGLGVLVEGTGKHRKDVIDLRLNHETTEDERGLKPARVEARVDVRDPSATVRRLYNEFCEPLALNAQEIAKAEAEVQRLRAERAEIVRTAWRRSRRSVGVAELEAHVERTDAERAVPAKTLTLTPEQEKQLRKDQATLNAFARKVLGG